MIDQNPRPRAAVAALVAAGSMMGLLAASLPVAAQDARLVELREAFMARGNAGTNLSRDVSRIFQDLDKGGDGIDAADIDIFRRMKAAEVRGVWLAQTFRYDLDGDGVVTRAEAEEAIAFEQRRRPSKALSIADQNRLKREFARLVDRFMAGDRNRDGRLEAAELAAVAETRSRATDLAGRSAEVGKLLLAFDADADGKLTEAEAFAALAKAFDGIDLSAKPAKLSAATARRENCRAIPPLVDGKLVLASISHGESLSNVSVAGQDHVTTALTVHVEAGEEPINLVLVSSLPTIWRIEGATQRVARVFVSAMFGLHGDTHVSAGLTGVARDKVTFVLGQTCLPHAWDSDEERLKAANAQAKEMFGRTFDAIIARRSAKSARVPSGTHLSSRATRSSNTLTIVKGNNTIVIGADGSIRSIETKSRPADAGLSLKDEFQSAYPGGVVKLDAHQVVSDVPAEPYAVLPAHAGLIQLMEEGAIESDGAGGFAIRKPMRYPAGLSAPHGRFVLRKGVPQPEGEPGNACVFSEEVGDYIEGRNCR